MSVKLSLRKMGIPVPEIARGVNPHEVIRQSMFTLEGPVFGGEGKNHSIVLLDQAGGMPCFMDLSGAKDMEALVELLDAAAPGHTWETSSEPTEKTVLKEAAEGENDNVIAAVTLYTDGNDKDPSDPEYIAPDSNFKLTVTVPSVDTNPFGTDTVEITKATAATADEYKYVIQLSENFPTEATGTYGTDQVEEPADTEAVLEERLTYLADRLYVVRAGAEYSEMTLLSALSDYDALDAAHDTCCKLEKGRVTNLCVLPLLDNAHIQEYAEAVIQGEPACLFVKSDGTRVTLAPASFADTVFTGWTKVVFSSIVVNDVVIKESVDKDGVKHRNLFIDITCC